MLIATRESRTTNHKENIYKYMEAIKHCVLLGTKTTIGTMPFALGLGIDLRETLFRDDGSVDDEDAKALIRKQISAIIQDELKDLTFRTEDRVVYILITLSTDDSVQMPVIDLNDRQRQFGFDEITVD